MRLADIEGELCHGRAPPRTVLCEGGPLGEGGAIRVLDANVPEVALERPAVSHLLSARPRYVAPHTRWLSRIEE